MFSRFGVAYQPAFAIVTADGEVQTLSGSADEATILGLVEAAA